LRISSALSTSVFEVRARLHRVGVEDLGRRHAQRQEDVQLGDGGDLEAGAFLDQDLEDARIGVRLDREVRTHARQRRPEAARLGAHDVQVHEQDRLAVGVLLEVLLDPAEVEAGFRVGVEGELRLRAELLDRGGSGHLGVSDDVSVEKDGARRHTRASPAAGTAVLVPRSCHDDLLHFPRKGRVRPGAWAPQHKNLREV
jgi:hypothetical protein